MRAFIVLCLVAACRANLPGYNYQPVLQAPITGSLGSVSSGGKFRSTASQGITNLGIASGSQVGNGGLGFSNLGFNVPSDNTLSNNAPAQLEKEFYTFSAPESEFDDNNVAERIVSSVKQGLRVIFIKGPENNSLEKAALAVAKHAAEQKTAIYVLNKQADVGDLAQKLNVLNKSTNNKPEVHFVKYRTQEDAASAQKAIQSQYDLLGGTSQAHNGGVAPVINFASPVAVHTTPAQAPRNAYLPSSIFRS